jgi:hypothetical protein
MGLGVEGFAGRDALGFSRLLIQPFLRESRYSLGTRPHAVP